MLILTGVALLVALVWFLSGARISRGAVFESYFSESVQGLEVGAAVKYRGVTIGRVNEVGLVSAEYGAGQTMAPESTTYRQVFIRYVLDASKIGQMPDTRQVVGLGLRVRLASQGITGLSYLELDFVSPERYPALDVPWQPKSDYIPSMPSTFAQVQDAAQKVLTNLSNVDIDHLTTQLGGLVTDLRTNLASGDVHATLAEATTALRSISESIRAADLPALAADIRRSVGSIGDTLQGEPMQKLLSNAGLAADRLATAAARLPPLLTALQATTQRAGNGTADIEQGLVPLLRDMKATAQNLREMTESLRRYPAQVLSPPPPRVTEPAR